MKLICQISFVVEKCQLAGKITSIPDNNDKLPVIG